MGYIASTFRLVTPLLWLINPIFLMRNAVILLFSLLLVASCKTQQKTPVNKESVSQEKTIARESKVVVTSINGKYLFEDSTNINVYLEVDFLNLASETSIEKLSEIFRVQWAIVPESGIKEKLKAGRVELKEGPVRKSGKNYQMTFQIPKLKNIENGSLVVDFVDIQAATKYTYDLPINFYAKKVDTRYQFFDSTSHDFPRFNSFVYQNEKVILKSLQPNSEELFLIRFKNLSGAALSPMSSTKKDIMSEYQAVDTVKVLNGQELTLSETGTYLLTQNPQDVADGYGFIVVDKRYPRQTMAGDMREPLVYMSTQKEIDILRNTEDPKDAIDLYFLNICKGNQSTARQMIKNYYRRVSDANRLFSNYKEGWKTDKGMVYIIMGPPSRVQRNRQREVWLYSQSQNNSEIIYTFYRKTNTFTDLNYELVRYPEYSSYWYPYVEAWRTGNVVE